MVDAGAGFLFNSLPQRSERSEDGQVAQLVEQRIENPRVDGSIPPLATNSKA